MALGQEAAVHLSCQVGACGTFVRYKAGRQRLVHHSRQSESERLSHEQADAHGLLLQTWLCKCSCVWMC